MKHCITLLIFCLLVQVGCNHNTDNKEDNRKQFYNAEELLVKRTFYEVESKEATILTERTFKDDTIPHGYARSYYQNGQLMGEEHFKNGVKHGVSKRFYKNGQLNQISWLKNGVLDSLGIIYYLNGQIDLKSFWHKGKQLGEQLCYNPNGRLIKYLFYDPVGELVYRRQYKEDGELLNEEGVRNTQMIYMGTDDKFTVGETLSVKIYAPTPPDCEVKLFISIKDENGQVMIDNQFVSVKNGLATYQTKVSETGKYYFESTLNFKDLKTGEQEEYINVFDYTVVNNGTGGFIYSIYILRFKDMNVALPLVNKK